MESLPILISVGAFVFTIYQFLRNSNREGTTQITTVLIKLENIADGIAEIKPATDTLHVKQNGAWKQVAKTYKKTNGTWTEIDPADAFQSGVKLVLGH